MCRLCPLLSLLAQCPKVFDHANPSYEKMIWLTLRRCIWRLALWFTRLIMLRLLDRSVGYFRLGLDFANSCAFIIQRCCAPIECDCLVPFHRSNVSSHPGYYSREAASLPGGAPSLRRC